MLDQVTDNMKFFIMLAVYIVYLTWWAASLNTSVEQQILVTQKTVQLLDSHIDECNKRKVSDAIMYQDLKHLKNNVEELIHEQHSRTNIKGK